ncbi:recombination-associated protein RdgC [Pseudomonas aeruginosa]|nr:recombination-associated protein RdgC [Pseudomonas aeruginosa]
MKDEIVQTLLPRAFIRRSSTFAAIAPSLGLILVDSASAKKAKTCSRRCAKRSAPCRYAR